MTAPTAAPVKLPEQIYGVIYGGIDQESGKRISNNLSVATVNQVKHLHILFQSAGGYVGDGVALYNLFRSIPIDLTLYNVGQLSSAAVIAYLGAKCRKTSTNATFMIHRSTNSPQFATSKTLQHVAKSLLLDDDRTERIVRAHTKIPDELWNEIAFHDVYLSGQEAVDFGIATEIGEFEPPLGVQVFNFLG